MLDPNEIKLMKIFNPFATRELLRAVSSEQRFVHYTSASVAMNIIQRREIWMRKISCMNDYMEVRHGTNLLIENWNNKNGKTLKEFLEKKHLGIVTEIADMFDNWLHDIQYNTYISCISKHHESEDKIGRLSMWRAYGGNSGVALVIKGSPFFRTENTINVFSTPIAYVDGEGFSEEFAGVVASIVDNDEFVSSLERNTVKNSVFNILHFTALGSKHPGFREEQEWRVIHSPQMHPSNFVKKGREVIQGEPQTVYKLPLRNNQEHSVDWIDVDDILDRVIIGPSVNGYAVYEAFVDMMEEEGITNPENRVFLSDIPLR
ncbi:MAG: DUF2971 domain-containing protein [Ahrensia sp.]